MIAVLLVGSDDGSIDLLRSFKRGVVDEDRGGRGGGSGSIIDTDLLYLFLAAWKIRHRIMMRRQDVKIKI